MPAQFGGQILNKVWVLRSTQYIILGSSSIWYFPVNLTIFNKRRSEGYPVEYFVHLEVGIICKSKRSAIGYKQFAQNFQHSLFTIIQVAYLKDIKNKVPKKVFFLLTSYEDSL